MNPIRVLLIAPSMRIVGGQSIQANHLLRYIGVQPEIALSFLAFDAPLPAWLAFPIVRTLARSVFYWIALLRRTPGHDILHVFTASNWSYTLWSLPALAATRLYRKKIVLHYHDGRAEDHLRNWRSAIPTLRLMDAIVGPSGYLSAVFARFGLQCRSIYNVIDYERYRFRPRTHPKPRLLHSRSMEPLYNVACTLRAFAIVQQAYPDAELILTGGGPLRAELEQLAASLHLRHVQFIGAVPNAAIPGLLDQADIYITTPNIDCMPVSLLECYAAGLPVVATNAGGIPYIATHEKTALLANCDDHQAIAALVLRLLREPGLAASIAEQAFAECQARYGGPTIARQWVHLYREVAARP